MKKKKPILLIGAGGHANSCVEVIERSSNFYIAGFISSKHSINDKIFNYKVLSNKDNFEIFYPKIRNVAICIGQIKSSKKREMLYKKLKKIGFSFPVFFPKSSYVSKTAKIDEGTIIMNKCVINSKVKIGKCCIINTSSVIEHDVNIEDFCHISTSVTVNGACNIGTKSFIGSGSVLRECITLKKNTFIKMKSSVKKSNIEK